MIEVEVEFAAVLARSYRKNGSTIKVAVSESATVRDLLSILSKFKACKEISRAKNGRTDYEIVVLIDGKYSLDGAQTKLKNRTKVTLLPIIAGG